MDLEWQERNCQFGRVSCGNGGAAVKMGGAAVDKGGRSSKNLKAIRKIINISILQVE